MHISIVGTAGRREDGAKMSKALYIKAYFRVLELIQDKPIADRKLISGGAAWADHLAVSLYLSDEASSLDLHIPTQFITDANINMAHAGPIPGFFDTGVRDWRTNPGGTANYYHKLFSEKVGNNTLAGIERALLKGATIHDHYQWMPGSPMHARNLSVSQCDLLIALTWGEGDTPKDGGTAHTWSSSTAPTKIHIPLGSL